MMKLGLLTAILDNYTFEEAVDFAAQAGFASLEVACWKKGEGERRYAGVSHIDCERVCADDEYAAHILKLIAEKGLAISALAYYPNVLSDDAEAAGESIEHLKAVILASSKLNVNLVTTFIGRNQYKSVEENLRLVSQVWPSILELAEQNGVRIAIENCPMLFGPDQWPGGQNLMHSPAMYRKIFELLPSDSLGLNFDPSHYVWQGLDYVRTVYEFRDKIFHIHFKDIKLYPEKLKECGCLAYPLDYMSPKIPGLGDVDWSAFVSALNDIRYRGYTAIEIEDKAFEGSNEDVVQSILQSKAYLSQFVWNGQ